MATGTTLDLQTGVTTVPLTAGATSTDPGTAVQLCFKVTADAALEPSLVTNATRRIRTRPPNTCAPGSAPGG
ncbi:hypothetical protein [Microbacterium maritypicum]|uniref:Uncharacterized protein n=1 Tax=Microbacterium maritypicum TaxID=33918 RepID=A0A4Y4B506_MICMQ|nr:hypothetical protein [Microbacterium liquefaciens]GEC74300.1 hypothetical protein MLI01_04450 [Microbacterium liquefaciens]GGV50328.1 hypothetical protein GCM10010213_04460 [Microbacterium liquefaciens]